MGNSCGAFLAAFHIFYHSPSYYSIPTAVIAAYGATLAGVPWWAILVQMLGGVSAAIAIIRHWPTTAPNEPFIDVTAMPVTNSRYLLHWVSSLVGMLAYGFLYYLDMPTARLVDPSHVWQPWNGPLLALCVVLAADATMHAIRRLWSRVKQHTPPVRAMVFAFGCILAVCVDLAVHAEHWTAYLFPVVPVVFALQVLGQENVMNRPLG